MTGTNSYKAFKKEWIQRKAADEKKEIERMAKEQLKDNEDEPLTQEAFSIKSLDQVRAETKAKREFQKNLKQLSKVQVNIVKDKAEVLVSTSHDELHKHGYKPFVRWGVMRETLTAACLLESGILQKAQSTGKLYLWDPFCGSGSFVIEAMMMLLDQPVRNFEDVTMPFEYWPIHHGEEYAKFREDLNDFGKMIKRREIDVQLIGSDISQKAFETTCKNVEYSEIQRLIEEGLVEPRAHRIINDPMTLASHWPKPFTNSADVEGLIPSSSSVLNLKSDLRDRHIMSVYQGDFQTIGTKLADLTDGFKDFSIVTNVPYGV